MYIRLYHSVFIGSILIVLVSCNSAKSKTVDTIQQCSFTPSDFTPGEIVPDDVLANLDYNGFFTNNPIPDSLFEFMQGKSFKTDCTIDRESLRYLICLHRDAENNAIVGEMVLNDAIAADVLDILKCLYENSYPIERMRLVDYYDADDETSMRDNNSSSFNFRFISHTTTVSKHGLGMAVDINPLYNPYHKTLSDGTEVVEPATAAPYLDRTKEFAYKITSDDLCCKLFKEKGFDWGGDWKNKKDYQHFEK